jgi:hypothetical protein
MDFAFFFDSRLRQIVERDYAELHNLDPRRATKSVITLSGSIIEALLFDALVASGKWTFEKACENKLNGRLQRQCVVRCIFNRDDSPQLRSDL